MYNTKIILYFKPCITFIYILSEFLYLLMKFVVEYMNSVMYEISVYPVEGPGYRSCY